MNDSILVTADILVLSETTQFARENELASAATNANSEVLSGKFTWKVSSDMSCYLCFSRSLAHPLYPTTPHTTTTSLGISDSMKEVLYFICRLVLSPERRHDALAFEHHTAGINKVLGLQPSTHVKKMIKLCMAMKLSFTVLVLVQNTPE